MGARLFQFYCPFTNLFVGGCSTVESTPHKQVPRTTYYPRFVSPLGCLGVTIPASCSFLLVMPWSGAYWFYRTLFLVILDLAFTVCFNLNPPCLHVHTLHMFAPSDGDSVTMLCSGTLPQLRCVRPL